MATTRFSTNDDNTGRLLKMAQSDVAYAATVALTPNASVSFYNVAQLTGALTINLTVSSALKGDVLYFTFSDDGSGRVVTFGTGFKASGTLTLAASGSAAVQAVFDGTNFVLCGREISA